MCSGRGSGPLHPLGFPIRKSPDLSLVADSPGLIAGSYVLLRLLVPRHPPCALTNLATTDDARVHCAVLKIRAVPVSLSAASGEPGKSVHRGDQPAAVPSGPNSVLGPYTNPSRRSSSPGQTRRTVLSRQELMSRPNSQCSTSELPTRDHAVDGMVG